MIRKRIPVKKVEFKISASEAGKVDVAGDFNSWKTGLLSAKKDRRGIWKVAAKLPMGTYEYKFFVDGAWILDPSCSRRVVNSFGTENSVVVVE